MSLKAPKAVHAKHKREYTAVGQSRTYRGGIHERRKAEQGD